MTKPKYYLKPFWTALRDYHKRYLTATRKDCICGIEKRHWDEIRLFNQKPKELSRTFSVVNTKNSYYRIPLNCLTKRYEMERRAK